MSIRERLDSLSRGELAGSSSWWSSTLAGAGLWYMRSLPKPVHVAAPARGAPVVAAHRRSGAGVARPPAPPPIIVDVAGWVRDPGVYEFATGERVIDAIERGRRRHAGRRPHER